MEKIIEIKDLKKSYGDLQAVDGVSFSVKKGEIFGLLGPNGAGKTTTLEIIETLRVKDSGSITVAGFDVDSEQEEIKKIIGVQLQSAGYYPRLNLTELLEMFAGLYGVDVDAEALLEKVQLKDKAKALVNELSGGQRQRFSITSTLINEPKVVFLDEPTTGLDPQARRNLWELIKEIRSEGTTVVLTTHYMDEAEILCDRVGIMDEGKIIKMDTPDKLIDDLIASGFKKPKETRQANLEDVFIDLTGKNLRE